MIISEDQFRLRQRFEDIELGRVIPQFFLRPCRLKILMVVDGFPGSFLNVSYSHSYFGLSAVLDTLRDNPEHFVKFDVTRAHRQTDTFKPNPATDPDLHDKYGPHFENFRFDQPGFNVDEYDQIWFFGARGNPLDSQRLSIDELEVVSRWMDAGGGVFATGDHADLGASLCSGIPRVRSMRKWTAAQSVPSGSGVNRHDTLDKGDNSVYTFDDESDTTPMTITYKKYALNSFSPFVRRHQPHALLCGQKGVIDILPDHPHEGEVIDTAGINLSASFSFNGYSNDEFPSATVSGPKPEVVAWAHVKSDHTAVSDLNKGFVNAKTFGAIGAYDGQDVDIGRVAVDSTWHHWFDVNLTGRPQSRLDSPPNNASNPKTEGFLYDAAGQAEYRRIQNYFRNVGMWLADKPKQRCMFIRALWGSLIRYPLVEEIHSRLTIWQLGELARDAIGRTSSKCTLNRWVIDLFPVEVLDPWRKFELPDDFPGPCLTCPPLESLEIFTLGGIMQNIVEVTDIKSNARLEEVDEKLLSEALVKGAETGLQLFVENFKQSISLSEKFVSDIGAAAKDLPKASCFEAQSRPVSCKKKTTELA
ncbi:hypothetical protein [Teredinibacter franksiae]|uniref:hypothetical protein n=1 Tax=Teredinibacter franksiae TaxID=2761453 RepID=UPI0016248E44|nr:hypothetical protein [Teredinibacter franksiae]